MSDDLVKRLRKFDWVLHELEIVDQAAERIEELEAKLAEQIEWVKRLADDLIASEAKLEKAVEGLDRVMVGGNHLAVWLPDDHPPADMEPLAALEQIGAGVSFDVWCCWRSIMLARSTLAELKGQDDE